MQTISLFRISKAILMSLLLVFAFALHGQEGAAQDQVPDDAAATGARSVVISSWMHESAIWKRREMLEAAGLRVFPLYTDAIHQGSTAAECSPAVP